MEGDEIYIEHILDAISKIEEDVRGMTSAEFTKKKNHAIQDAVIRELQVIGEATKHFSTALKKRYPELPWAKITGMRNKLIHEYFSVDLKVVWHTVRRNIPELKRVMEYIK